MSLPVWKDEVTISIERRFGVVLLSSCADSSVYAWTGLCIVGRKLTEFSQFNAIKVRKKSALIFRCSLSQTWRAGTLVYSYLISTIIASLYTVMLLLVATCMLVKFPVIKLEGSKFLTNGLSHFSNITSLQRISLFLVLLINCCSWTFPYMGRWPYLWIDHTSISYSLEYVQLCTHVPHTVILITLLCYATLSTQLKKTSLKKPRNKHTYSLLLLLLLRVSKTVVSSCFQKRQAVPRDFSCCARFRYP